MGDGYGPMLVATDPNAPTARSPDDLRDWLRGRPIAVPGQDDERVPRAATFPR